MTNESDGARYVVQELLEGETLSRPGTSPSAWKAFPTSVGSR
jgi:hypothetical protein